MGYCGCMGYEALFPVNQLGGLKNIWYLREYGVCEPWVMRESTVLYFIEFKRGLLKSNKSQPGLVFACAQPQSCVH